MESAATEILEHINNRGTESLIQEIKDNHNLKRAEQGLYIQQIMQNENLTRHKDVANLIGMSRSYVSIRIKAAREKYGEISFSRPVGRPKHVTMDLDSLYGDQVPLRLTSKIGELPNEELIEMLMIHIVHLSKDSKKLPNDEVKEYLNKVIDDILNKDK